MPWSGGRGPTWADPRSRSVLPSLTLVRFMHDHTGNFDVAIDGVNTPELMVADNDYAVGLLIQKIAHSKYANNTLIFVVEDDAQDGGDHVDSHRSIAFVAGAYVKQGALVSTPYNTIDFVRTMEEVLGLPPMNLNDALGASHDRHLQHHARARGASLPLPRRYSTVRNCPSRRASRSSRSVPKPAHNAQVLGAGHEGNGFQRRRSRRSR